MGFRDTLPWKWPVRSKRQAEGLTGDMRPLLANETAQIIDATWPEPRPLLVAAAYVTSGGLGEWHLRWSVERGQFGDEVSQLNQFSRVVLARAVQLSFKALNAPGTARGVVVEAAVSVDALASSLLPNLPAAGYDSSDRFFIPVSTIGVVLIAASPSPTAAPRRALLITNYSPANRYLFVNLGAIPAGLTEFNYAIPPNSTLEVPFNYVGQVCGIWDGADGAGRAIVSEIV